MYRKEMNDHWEIIVFIFFALMVSVLVINLIKMVVVK